MNSIAKAALFSVILLLVFGLGTFLLLHRNAGKAPSDVEVGARQEDKALPKTLEGPKTGPVTDLVHHPSEEVTFTVKIIDQGTQKLLPRATLLVQKVTDGDRPGEKVYESGRRAAGASNGEFNVPVIPGIYQARAQCPGYSAATQRVTVVKDKPLATVVLALGRGNSISGRILTREGRGIGAARVLAYPQIGNPHASIIERLIEITKVTEDAQRPPAETTSADDGSYQIDGLDKRYYTVKAVAVGYSPTERSEILPTQDNVNLTLPLGGELPGAVVEKNSGSGVAGAKVMAYTHVDSSDLFSIIETRARPPFETVVTGAGGEFKFQTLGSGTYNFVVSAKGWQEGRFLKIRVREGENPAQTFGITRGLSIAGTVVSAGGEPVAGAKVRATRVGDTGRSEQIFIKFEDGSIPTDAQGKFTFDTLEPGKYTLLAWHQDHATEQRRDVDAGTDDLTITLPAGGAVSGNITEGGTGRAIAGARISINDMQDLRKEAITDDKGMYYVGGLNSGGQSKHYMNIHADGYARLSNVQVHVEDNKVTESQNFELRPTAMVSGRVVNNSGAGVAGGRVLAKRKGPNSVPLTVGSAVTADDGRYQIKDLEGGEDTVLSVMSSDYLEGESQAFSVEAGGSVEMPDLVLQLGGMVQGVVVGPDGRGIPGVQLSVRLAGQTVADVALSASSDNRGQFTLRGLAAGTVDVLAKSPHFVEEVVSGVKVAEGLVTSNVRVVLRQGAHIKGTVVDAEGKPVRDAQVTAQDISGGLKEIRTESDQDGRFTLESLLSADAIEVQVEHPDYGSWANEKVPVNTEDLKVVMPRLGGIRAVVVDAEGNAVPSFSVQPQAKDSGGDAAKKRLSAKTYQVGPANKDGSFEYTGIPPGVYDIYVRAPSYSAFTFPDVQVSGQVVDLGRAELQEGGVISGVVVDTQSGRPVPGASLRVLGGMVKFNMAPGTVSARPAGDQSLAVSDARGGFEFRNLKGGPVTIMVTAKGYVNRRIEDIDPNVADKSRNLKIVLELGAEIFGSVVDAQGNARNGVSVYLTGVGEMAAQSDANQRTATNSEGRFQFVGLSSGTYRVTAQRLGDVGAGNNPSVEVPIGSGSRQEVELVFE